MLSSATVIDAIAPRMLRVFSQLDLYMFGFCKGSEGPQIKCSLVNRVQHGIAWPNLNDGDSTPLVSGSAPLAQSEEAEALLIARFRPLHHVPSTSITLIPAVPAVFVS